MSLTLNCTLLCASGASYDINPLTGIYTPDAVFSPAVAYTVPPTAISGDQINACLVGQTSIGIIVAFRGTIPPGDPDSFPDWLQDFFAEPVSAPGLPGLVHSGFMDALNSLIAGVINAVKALKPGPQNPVYVTGHSKGGGIAPLAAYLLQQTYGIPVRQTITFAAPKSGNLGFVTGYQLIFKNHLRYENYGDLVPLLPPADSFIAGLAQALSYIPDIGQELAKIVSEAAGWDYLEVGQELYIESNGNININEPDWEQIIDFVWNLASNILDAVGALANAHALGCGHGYMNGTCQKSVCG